MPNLWEPGANLMPETTSPEDSAVTKFLKIILDIEKDRIHSKEVSVPAMIDKIRGVLAAHREAVEFDTAFRAKFKKEG